MATRKLIGNLIDTRGKPQPEAEVWLSAAGLAAARTRTDAQGRFEFDLDDGWPAGRYRLAAPPTERALGADRTLSIGASGPPAPQVLTVSPRYEVSARTGGLFLTLLIVSLLGLVWLYFDWHGFSLARLKRGEPPTAARPIRPELSAAVDTALQQARKARARAEAAAEPAEPPAQERPPAEAAEDTAGSPELEADTGEQAGEETAEGDGGDQARAAPALAGSGVAESLATVEELLMEEEAARGTTLARDQLLVAESLIARARTAIADDDLEGLAETLTALRGEVVEEGAFFWSEWPAILLETLFWALGATLIRLIFSSGTFLYRRTFLATAVPRHLALLFSVPILAVLISFVLSLVRISVELSEITLELDMGNVYVAILVAALIGFAPWKAWNFLQDLADALFARLGRLVGREGAPGA